MNRTSIAAAFVATTVAMPADAVTRYRLTELSGPAAVRVINNNGMIAGETGARAGRIDDGSALIAAPEGYSQAYARGINSLGVVALTFAGAEESGLNDIAAFGVAGNAVRLDPLAGYAAAGAFGIGLDQVAGYSLKSGSLPGFAGSPFLQAVADGDLQATLWNGLVATKLANPFGNGNSIATAINEAGTVGGTVLDAARRQRATIWAADGTATALGLQAGQNSSLVRDINDHGDAIGRTVGTNGLLATVWSGSHVYTLAGLGPFTDSTGRGLNDRGQAVGFASETGGNAQGMFWEFNGSGYDSYLLDSLVVNLGGWQTSAAQSINDDGSIVGLGFRPDGSQGSYLLTAVPEPATWAMFIAGFGLIGTMARRRQPPKLASEHWVLNGV